MRIQRTSRIITATVILLSLLTVASALVSQRYRAVQERNYAQRRIALRTVPQLAAGSDRLTNAARAYAATGDRQYYEAFVNERDVERTRERAIEQLRQLDLDARELSLLTQAKQDSDRLVGVENRAFEAAAKGDTPTAIALVYGPEFRTTKTAIMQAIAECGQSLDARLTRHAEEVAGHARIAGYVGLLAVIASAVMVATALLWFYRGRVVNPLLAINQSLHDLLAHRGGVAISHVRDASEIGEVARSLESYRRAADEVETQRSIKSSVSEINAELQTTETADAFALALLSKLVPLANGGCGAFYLFQEATGTFAFAGGYACRPRADIGSAFAPGEGIVGECAARRRRLVLRDLPDGYTTITSGVGAAPPRVVVATPLLSRDRVLAVLEIASFAEPTTAQTALLDEVASAAALNLEILLRNLHARELLEQLQQTNLLADGALELTKAGYWH